MSRTLVSLALLLGACAPQVVVSGDQIYKAYPFDALREWTFQADDTTIPYRLEARQLEGFEEIGDEAVYTLEFLYACFNDTGVCEDADDNGTEDIEGEVAFTWRMSATRRAGVLFHAIDDTTFDPPVAIADGDMLVGDEVVTTSGGITYTATYEGEETCPAPGLWPEVETRPDCFKNVVDDGGVESPVGGTYWATTRVSLTAFQLDEGPLWQARDFDVPED